jgi:hypothetical protein
MSAIFQQLKWIWDIADFPPIGGDSGGGGGGDGPTPDAGVDWTGAITTNRYTMADSDPNTLNGGSSLGLGAVTISSDGQSLFVGLIDAKLPATSANCGRVVKFVGGKGAWVYDSTLEVQLAGDQTNTNCKFGVEVACSADGSVAAVASDFGNSLAVVTVFRDGTSYLIRDLAEPTIYGRYVTMSSDGSVIAINEANGGSSDIFIYKWSGSDYVLYDTLSGASAVPAVTSFGIALFIPSGAPEKLFVGCLNSSKGVVVEYVDDGTEYLINSGVSLEAVNNYSPYGLRGDYLGDLLYVSNDDNPSPNGASYLLTRNGASWDVTKKIVTGVTDHDRSAMSDEGLVVAVSDHNWTSNTGRVVVLENDAGTLTEVATFSGSSTGSNLSGNNTRGFTIHPDGGAVYAIENSNPDVDLVEYYPT